MYNAKNQKDYHERQKAKGLVKRSLVVYPHHWEAIKAFNKQLQQRPQRPQRPQ